MSDVAVRKLERRGRPAYDDLQIYAFVEAGRRRTGLNVKTFCSNTKVLIAKGIGKDGNGLPRLNPNYETKRFVALSGEALRTRYYKARRTIRRYDTPIPEGLVVPAASSLRDELEKLIEREIMYQNELPPRAA